MRSWLEEFTVLGFGLVVLMFGFYPLIPGRAAWHKALFVEGLIVIGLIIYVLAVADRTGYVLNLFFWAMGIALVTGLDYAGATPYQKSQADPWLGKLGVKRIGPVNLSNRARIWQSRISLDRSLCNACAICYDVCPTSVYEIERGRQKKIAVKYPGRCEACGACVLQCPTSALSLYPEDVKR